MRRMWIGNPGCADEPCCDEDEECGDLCITMTMGDPGSTTTGTGILIDGGDLGTCTTDGTGKCCFDPVEPGTYDFTASKTGYLTNTFRIVVTEEDCDGSAIIKPGGNIIPTTPGPGCKDYFIWQCRWCPRPGVPITFTATGWTLTVVTQTDGRVRLCFPPSIQVGENTITMTIPGDGGPQIQTQIVKTWYQWLNIFAFPSEFQADRADYWHCLPADSNHCMIPWHTQLNVTFGPTWNEFSGTTHQLDLDIPASNTGEAAYTTELWNAAHTAYIRISVRQQWEHSNACGNKNHMFGQITYRTAPGNPPYSTQSFDSDLTYGSHLCPVNGKLVLNIGGTVYPADYLIVTE